MQKHGSPIPSEEKTRRSGFLDFYEKLIPEMQARYPDTELYSHCNFRTKVCVYTHVYVCVSLLGRAQ